jgi:SseB protein C-terminal domain
MVWFFRKKRRRPEERYERTIRFVGEQDGPIERDLKADLLHIFIASPELRAAYLVRATYDSPAGEEVILAVRSSSGDDVDLVRRIAECFGRHFSKEVHMDVMFLPEEREAEVRLVCTPFYQAA